MFTRRQSRLHFGLVAILAALIGLGSALIGEGRTLAADDDNLWLAAVVAADSRSDLRVLETRVIETLRESQVGGANLARYEKRREYGANYRGAIAVWRWAGRQWAPGAWQADASDRTLARRMVVMFAAGLVLAWGVFAWTMTRLTDAVVARAVLLGVTLAALWFVLLPIQFSQVLGLDKGLAHLLPELVFTLLRPHDGLSLFGFTGRNLFAVLFLGVMVLRWSGRDRLAAVAYALAAMQHASYATLLLPFLLACDLATRRRNLRDPLYLAILAAVAVYCVAGETLWRTLIEFDVWLLVPAVLAAAVLAVAIARLRGADSDAARPLADIGVMTALWLVSLPIAIVAGKLAEPNTAHYFWMQIHPRTLGVLQPLLAVGFAFWLLRSEPLSRSSKVVILSLSILLPLAGLHALASRQGALHRLADEYGQLRSEQSSRATADPAAYLDGRSERFVYFTIERALSGQPLLQAPTGRSAP